MPVSRARRLGWRGLRFDVDPQRLRKSLRRVISSLAFVLVVEYLVLPQLAGTRQALRLLSQVNGFLLLVGFALEAASLLAYAQLTSSLLPHDGRPAFFTLVRIQLSTLAVSHVVPGGAAAGTGLGYDLLTDAGVRRADAAFALGTQGIGSAVVLNLLLWVGLVVSIPGRGFDPLYASAALVGVILLGAFASAVLLLTKGEESAARWLRKVAARLPVLDEDVVERSVRRLAFRLRQLLSDRPLLRQAVGWATANWLLDAASLWVFLAAFGHRMGPDGLLVSYGLANVLAAIPVTPGGLGVVEGVLTPTLVAFGAPRGQAILGVLGWRFVQFWLPIPVGALAYLSLKVAPGASPLRKAEALRVLAERSRQEAEDAPSWAARHGIKVPKGH